MNNNINLDYLEYYIKELESRNGDIEKITQLKKLRDLYLQQETNRKQPQKSKKIFKKANNKKVVKRPSLKKQLGMGILVGTIIGVPASMLTYTNAIHSPSAHNYKTVRETRLNLEHDNSNYIKYLKKSGLNETQIDERLAKEESENRWNREQDDFDER